MENTKLNETPSGGEVPDVIAQLMKAETFDIGQHKIEDFRATAAREQHRSLRFTVSRPPATSSGVALLTRKASQLRTRLVPRRNGKASIVKFARPTAEFVEPELAEFLETVHLVPVVDITTTTPAAYLWPFRITAWQPYEKIYSTLGALDDAREGLYLRYRNSTQGTPGDYEVDRFFLEPSKVDLWKEIRWPTADEVRDLVDISPFGDLVEENFNIKRAWARVETRRAKRS